MYTLHPRLSPPPPPPIHSPLSARSHIAPDCGHCTLTAAAAAAAAAAADPKCIGPTKNVPPPPNTPARPLARRRSNAHTLSPTPRATDAAPVRRRRQRNAIAPSSLFALRSLLLALPARARSAFFGRCHGSRNRTVFLFLALKFGRCLFASRVRLVPQEVCVVAWPMRYLPSPSSFPLAPFCTFFSPSSPDCSLPYPTARTALSNHTPRVSVYACRQHPPSPSTHSLSDSHTQEVQQTQPGNIAPLSQRVECLDSVYLYRNVASVGRQSARRSAVKNYCFSRTDSRTG